MVCRIAAALLFASAFVGSASATTISFTGSNAALGHSHTYGTVTAYAFTAGGTDRNLYGKNGGGSENGVGVSGQKDNEITSTTFVQLDVTSITSPFSLSIGSTQMTDGFKACFSATLGTIGTSCTTVTTPGADPYHTMLLNKPAGDNYISIEALGTGNVLLDSLTTSPTPEPSSLLLLGTGIIGVAGALRRKLS